MPVEERYSISRVNARIRRHPDHEAVTTARHEHAIGVAAHRLYPSDVATRLLPARFSSTCSCSAHRSHFTPAWNLLEALSWKTMLTSDPNSNA